MRLSSCVCAAHSLENHYRQSERKQKLESKKLKGPFQLSPSSGSGRKQEMRITMALSHPSATTTLIFNPYLPLVGRLLDVLLTYGPPGTAIETCNRTLAQLADCSAGAIPAALRRLEADGYIERVVTTHGSLIVVTERSGMLDRSPTASSCDQDMPDRCLAAPSPEAIETPDRPVERSEERSSMADPPEPPTWNQHESHEQQPCARESLFGELIAAGAVRTVATQILERNPQLTIAEFDAMRQIARSRRGVENGGIGLVFWCLLNNEPLYTPKEVRHERRYSDHQRPNRPQPRAGGNHSRSGARSGAARRTDGGTEKRDRYGAGAAYRERPAESDLPAFLQQARERTRQAASTGG
jgi:hypothetical protein